MKSTISEQIASEYSIFKALEGKIGNELRVASPGIIESFNAAEQTVKVRLAIRERMRNENLEMLNVEIPVLEDVPIVLPRAGGFAITFPIKKGDECLVIFSDACIDAWFSSGGVQNQIEKRRHDLSDAFAILGTWSQPRKVPNYNTESMEMKSELGSSRIRISDNSIDINSNTVRVNGQVIT